MRGWSTIVLLCGCSFDHGTARGADANILVGADAAPLTCPTKFVWTADFTVDPTTLNNNAGPEPDWRVREGGAFPGWLTDGVWSIGGPTVSLDTQPKTDFNRRTRATARMRNTSAAGTHGVMLSLNADYSPMTFMPLYVELRLAEDGTSQTATLYGKDMAGEITIAVFPDLGTDMLDVMLDVDPMMNEVTVRIGNLSATHVYMPIPRMMNDDRFATLSAYSDSEVDDARVEVCM
jgi:hypothetical protein